MRRFLIDNRGNVALTFGLVTPVLFLAAAVAVDYSDAGRTRTLLQSTADAAALAGAKDLGISKSETVARDTTQRYIEAKAAQATRTIAIDLQEKTVTVDLKWSKPAHFGGILGQGTIDVAVRSVAIYDVLPVPCMLALGPNEPSGINLIGAARVNASKCVVESNATGPESIRTQGAASITAYKVCSAGGSDAKSSPPPTRCKPGSDPYKDRDLRDTEKTPTPRTGKLVSTVLGTYSGPCDFTNMAISTKGSTALRPGIYCGGLSVQSSDVVLAPGLYVMQDGPLSLQGNASVSGVGVSILLSGSGAVLDLQGSPSLTLVAMATGSLAGIAIGADTPASPILASTLQGSPDVTLTGSVYLPNQRLELQGNPKLNLLGGIDTLIALSFRLQGSPDINIKSDSTKMKTEEASVRLIK